MVTYSQKKNTNLVTALQTDGEQWNGRSNTKRNIIS